MGTRCLLIRLLKPSDISETSILELELFCEPARWNVQLTPLCDSQEYEDIQWYFEDYAEHDPFATTRANHAIEILERYSKTLADALELQNCPWTTQNDKLRIEVLLDWGNGDSMSTVLWESLEDLSLWPHIIRPSSAIVVRRVAQTGEVRKPPTTEDFGDLNVVIVSARPQFDDDIGHRLVSKIILDAALSSDRFVKVDIVRPGTLQALKDHLSAREPGYFDVIHFDVHGKQQDGRTWLAFLKASPQDFLPHLVNASDIAGILLEHQVYHVVFNACRSARSFKIEENISAALISCGMSAVVAMSYNISSSSVERYTRAFFAGLFSGERMTFGEAAQLGRAALRDNREQTTVYGVTVKVDDGAVPVCYERKDYLPRTFLADLRCGPYDSDLVTRLEATEKNVVGRENDILLLEHNFLLGSNIGVLKGRAGTGKTALVRFLSSWWLATNFISKAIWFKDLDMNTQHIPKILRHLLPGKSEASQEEVVDTLRQQRYLIVFDSWESLKFPRNSSMSKQRKYLKDFFRAIHGGRSFVIVMSRRSEGWLSKLHTGRVSGDNSQETFLQVLEGLTPIRGMLLVTRLLTTFQKVDVLIDDQDTRYLERIVKLAEGNPLVLQLLAKDFSAKRSSIKTYYNELLEGQVVTIDDKWAKVEEGARSLAELRVIAHDLLVPDVDTLERQRRDIFARILRGEDLSVGDISHAIPLTIFAFFWGTLSTENLWWLMYFFGLEVRRTNHDTGAWYLPDRDQVDEVLAVCLFLPTALRDVEQALLESSPRIKEMQDMCEDVTSLLTSKNFIEPFPTDIKQMPRRPFLRLHPLVPIVARHGLDFASSAKNLKNSLVYFQCFCISRWPYEYQYWNPIWDEPKLEMGLTFLNFHVAVRTALRWLPGNFITESLICRLLQCVPKGLFVDASRYELIITTWDLVVPRAVAALGIGIDSTEAEIGEALLRSVGPPESPNIDQLLLVLFYAIELIVAAQGLMIAERESALGHAESTTKYGITSRRVSDAIVNYRNRITRELPSQVDNLIGTLKYNVKAVKFFTGSVGITEFWTDRQQYFRDLIGRSGVEQLPMNQEHWLDLPRSLNSLSVPFSPLVDVHTAVSALLDKEKYGAARAVLRQALDSEVNFAGNLVRNKIHLFQLLAKVDKREENWTDAIENTNRAHELETSISGPLPKLRRTEYEGKLAKLFEKAGDFDSMMSYVNLLLTKANEAHADDPELEIECLLRICKLEFSRRRDSVISDIFLLLRAALVSYRHHDSPSSYKCHWMNRFTRITNSRQPEWVFGATDPRRQTLAVAYLLMIFGQCIIFPYSGLLLPMLQQPDEGIFKEVTMEFEQSIFAEESEVTTNHMPQYLNYAPQKALFAHIYETGIKYLEQRLPLDGNREFVFPDAPRAPSTLWGNAGTGGFWGGTVMTPTDYVCSTELMLRMAGYIVEKSE